jgi:hypothetical protein
MRMLYLGTKSMGVIAVTFILYPAQYYTHSNWLNMLGSLGV